MMIKPNEFFYLSLTDAAQKSVFLCNKVLNFDTFLMLDVRHNSTHSSSNIVGDRCLNLNLLLTLYKRLNWETGGS